MDHFPSSNPMPEKSDSSVALNITFFCVAKFSPEMVSNVHQQLSISPPVPFSPEIPPLFPPYNVLAFGSVMENDCKISPVDFPTKPPARDPLFIVVPFDPQYLMVAKLISPAIPPQTPVYDSFDTEPPAICIFCKSAGAFTVPSTCPTKIPALLSAALTVKFLKVILQIFCPCPIALNIPPMPSIGLKKAFMSILLLPSKSPANKMELYIAPKRFKFAPTLTSSPGKNVCAVATKLSKSAFVFITSDGSTVNLYSTCVPSTSPTPRLMLNAVPSTRHFPPLIP